LTSSKKKCDHFVPSQKLYATVSLVTLHAKLQKKKCIKFSLYLKSGLTE
jgi:hypothetical protein